MGAAQTAFMQRYRQNNREAYNKYMREYRNKNKERIALYEKEYLSTRPWIRRARNTAYRARKKNATIGEVDIKQLLENWDGLCGICNLAVQDVYHIDHIIALANGGKHEQANLQVTHPTCNIKKGAK